MNCLHPFTRKYRDPISGEVKEVLCPCGHCINCLHAEQDMWSIRLGETAKYYKQMVFDTLTLSPYTMHYENLLAPTKDGYFKGTTWRWRQFRVDMIKKKYEYAKKYFPKMSFESWKLFKKSNFMVPSFPKKEVQNWIKRGRQFFYRDKGYRCNCAYFIVQEYGPQTSRPHYHVLFFGLNYSDYMHYFGNAWREEFGWTKPTYKQYTAHNLKDYNNMVRYVSKYICKGDFESPWVKDGFVAKSYRLISKGIGEGYLAKDYFNVFRSPELTNWMKFTKMGDASFNNKCGKLWSEGKYKELSELQERYKSQCEDIDYCLKLKAEDEFMPESQKQYLDLSFLTEDDVQHLQVYYDVGGYPHKLPQYYKNKLFRKNNEKNIYQFEIQNVLQQSALVYDNKAVQKEASALGITIPDSWLDRERTTWKLPSGTLFMVDYNHLLAQRLQAKNVAEGRYIKMKNFYNRLKTRTDAPALL